MPGRKLLRIALMLIVATGHAQQELKQFHDAATNVSFSYPAVWKLDGTLTDYIPTAILSGEGAPKRAVVKVGFPGIKNTNLTEVEFVYAFTSTKDEKSCITFAGSGDTSGWVTIGGVRYWRVSGEDAGMSHSAVQDRYAAFRAGRCYLFEEGVHSVAEGVADWAHPLPQAKLDAIHGQLDAVMRSVVIGS
jgi:hypothetical protein